MVYKVIVKKVDESKIYVDSDEPGVLYELHDHFSFFTEGYKFSPKFKAGFWDGKIKLFHLGKKTLPAGLIGELKKFCESRNYILEDDNSFSEYSVSLYEVEEFIKGLNLPIKPRKYQIKSFIKCIRKGRLTLLSPTSSGKSLIIYMLIRWYNLKTLIIVPTISLVNQMAGDFEEYGYEEEVHKIFGGQEKYSDEMVTVSTWQSIYKMKEQEFFEQYDVVIGDECHLSKALEFSKIMEKLYTTKYRFGTTGTLDDSKVNPLIIQGHFGEVYKSISTAEMMEQGFAATLSIKALVLKYDEADSKAAKGTYQEEIDWICRSEKRNKFIKNLVKSLDGNVLVLFNYVEKHGRVLEEYFNTHITDRDIYWISGVTSADDREEIRKIVNGKEKSILLASIKTSGTGINVPNLNHIVFVSPSKAKVQTLQNIGRVIRKSNRKDKATLYDIADDLRHKKYTNYTYNHFLERLKIYKREEFKTKIYEIGI
jgi:superfamily II DNA or RNA helicase